MNRRLRFRVFERDDFTCRYCGRRAPDVVLEVDHVHPRSSGGTDAIENLTTACLDCNRGKADSIVRRGVKLVGGPLDGVEMQTAEPFPLFWVYEKEGHGIFPVPDGWRVLKVRGNRICSHFPKLGHPITGAHPATLGYEALWQKPYPVLIGLYGWEMPGCVSAAKPEMEWRDPDMLLLRLTDLHYSLDATEYDEAAAYEYPDE